MNSTQIFQIMGAWKKFTDNHPKFPKFLQAVSAEGFREDTIVEVTVTTPEGRNYCSNLKITREDLELFEQLKNIR